MISALSLIAVAALLAACDAGGGNGNGGNGNGNGNGDNVICVSDAANRMRGRISIGDDVPAPSNYGTRPIEHDGGNADAPNRDQDFFGSAIASLGDLRGDGAGIEIAVGARGDNPESRNSGAGGGESAGLGAIFIYSLSTDGSVTGNVQKISQNNGGLCLCRENPSPFSFGAAVTPIGDRDGDGIDDIAVGAPGFEIPPNGRCGFTGTNRVNSGAVYILYMNSDGTVKADPAPVILAEGISGDPFPAGHPGIGQQALFGSAVVGIGDLDGDNVPDLAVGAPGRRSCGINTGGIFILLMNADESVKRVVHIGGSRGGTDGCNETAGLNAAIAAGNRFGASLAALGDLDGDGAGSSVAALAVGEPGVNRIRILFLEADGSIAESVDIDTDGTIPGLPTVNPLNPTIPSPLFGASLAALGDVTGGTIDIAVGAPETPQDPGINFRDDGTIYRMTLNSSGTVSGSATAITRALDDTVANGEITSANCNFMGAAENKDHFGSAVAYLGTGLGSSGTDLAVGAPRWRELRVLRQGSSLPGRPSCRFIFAGALWLLLDE